MKNNLLNSIAFITGLMFVFSSCQKDYEPETIENYEMSGQWYVQTYAGGTDNLVLGYEVIITSNTAAADGSSILIDDRQDIWPFKVKADANSGDLTFSANNVENMYSMEYDSLQNYVTITNGRVIPDGGRSISGVQVDSIYMECTFSEDTTNTTYIFAGHYKTGFEEDEP